jgi:hypothetical protein
MAEQRWVPAGESGDRPNAARIYDYLLGGYHNFEVDRLAAERLMQVHPDVRIAAHVNRAFLRRAVLFLVEQGIVQFLDIGSGIPTAGNVHEIAQGARPAARVVYVDVDPVAVAHSTSLLRDNPNTAVLQADAREPEQILNHVQVRELLDFRQPVAVLFLAILHLLPDDDQALHTVRTVHNAAVSGSYVAISHPTVEDAPSHLLAQIDALTAVAPGRYQYRSQAQILRFFDGLEWVEPGLVHTPLWRPEGPDDALLDHPARAFCLAGIGHKP